VVEAGRRVHQGDLLAQLDDRQVSADLDAARAKPVSTEATCTTGNLRPRCSMSICNGRRDVRCRLIPRTIRYARYKAESDHWDVERVKEMLANAHAVERSLELELEKTRIRNAL